MIDHKQLDARLRQLDQSCDRIGSNLLELDRHPAVALLKVSDLVGDTAARWSRAHETLAELFVAHGALRALIDDAQRQQTRGWFIPRLDELAALLDGQSIVVSDATARLADRDLLSASRIVVRRSPDQLIAEMSARYEQVREVVVSVASVWDHMIPRLREERQRVIELARSAEALGVDTDGLAKITQSLRDLSDRVLSDPLAVDRAQIDSIATVIDEVAGEVSVHRDLVDHWPQQVARARALLGEARAAICEYDALAARTETRITTPHEVVRVSLPPDLDDLLARMTADPNASANGRAELIAWCRTMQTALNGARSGSDRCRSLLAERAELRGLLEAYVAKASQLALLEDAEVLAAFEHAHAALYVAPTDLEHARHGVEQYRRLLAARSTP